MRIAIVEAELTGSRERTGSRSGREAGAPSLAAVFDANAAAMYRTILAFTGGRADVAEESVAEAFARATERWDELRDPVAWLYRVAFNVATDELRREGRGRHERTQDVPPPTEPGELFDAMRRLPPRQRAAMVLFYVNDLPVAEVATRMGVTRPTVRVHLTQGRRRLRELLGDDAEDDR
jgi:RNA polymerase sigma-70 factor (ECF subfamily)